MKWLITGGCGFLGTSLIQRLLQEGGNDVRVLDNLTTGTREDLTNVSTFNEMTAASIDNPPKGVELIVGDILDEKLALFVTKGCDAIVHFAANTGVGPSVEDPRADCMVNVIGTLASSTFTNYLIATKKSAFTFFSKILSFISSECTTLFSCFWIVLNAQVSCFSNSSHHIV